ncbi:MAG: Acetyl xylan esterase [Planctomycetaceae bacterium]|nr:Acetyl xylan esterase [Planctomycetaceae bacterium]
MRIVPALLLALIICCSDLNFAHAQALGLPDRDSPGDQQIQEYLGRLATQNYAKFAGDLASHAEWTKRLAAYRQEYLYMLGLHPLPERTPLNATITGSLNGDGYVVDMIHYQSKPGLYVTGNLYRPAKVEPGQKLPAVFYVCGHARRGRDGNKTAYQSHGIWFARHGYVCLVVDTLQLGEIAAIHHGTYSENRWWWHSRGYTSAGVECWNGVRGIDYLISRADVDPERIAVTGISGGGAATFWIAAADERVRVAVPVSGMADLLAYVPNRVINGHCDCMFLYNTFDWPWVRIAGLIAPRPMLFANSDNDAIFPMDANERVSNQLERLYSLYGASDKVDAMVSVGGHAYREDLRQAIYRFINIHLKQDSRPVTDSEIDLVEETGGQVKSPIDPIKLRVFAQDSDIPKDQLNTTIDEHFVPFATVEVPTAEGLPEWKTKLKAELRRVVFRALPESIPAAKATSEINGVTLLETEPGVIIGLRKLTGGKAPGPIGLLVMQGDVPVRTALPKASNFLSNFSMFQSLYLCETRGAATNSSRWTRKNPPNYVERSHVLLGRTADTGRILDIVATVKYLKSINSGDRVEVAGSGSGAILAAYAALLAPEIDGVLAGDPPLTHMDPSAPQFLNILRVADVPEMFGLLAPRKLTIVSSDERLKKTVAIYAAAGGEKQLTLIPIPAEPKK